MTPVPSPRTKPSLTSLVAFFLVVQLVLYVLSIGPAIALDNAGYIDDEQYFFGTNVYLPLLGCYENSEWFAHFLDWYIELWTG